MTERNARKELRALKTRIGVFDTAKTRNTSCLTNLSQISFWKSLCQHPIGVIAERIFWKLTIPLKRKARQRKSPYSSLLARSAWAYPGFLSMKRLGVSLFPAGWDASPSQGPPPTRMLLIRNQLPIYSPFKLGQRSSLLFLDFQALLLRCFKDSKKNVN